MLEYLKGLFTPNRSVDTITAPLRGIIDDLHEHAEIKGDEIDDHVEMVKKHNELRRAAEIEHEKAKIVALNITGLLG